MSKQFKRGSSKTYKLINQSWGAYKPYTKSLIIRGIGYRMFILENDYTETLELQQNFINKDRPISSQFIKYEQNTDDDNVQYFNNFFLEFNNLRYLLIRAGHTMDLYLPLTKDISIKTAKKDRKITIYGINKNYVNNLAREIFNYRKPSVYTGRGIRRKHIKPIKKAGKKDKQKGKAF